MDPLLIEKATSAIAIIATFGMPVAIVFLVSHFKYKNKELEAELEARRMLSERDKAELSARIERLETVLLGARAQQLAPQQGPAALPEPIQFPEAAPLDEQQAAAKRARER